VEVEVGKSEAGEEMEGKGDAKEERTSAKRNVANSPKTTKSLVADVGLPATTLLLNASRNARTDQ
jgi:hypothetical protein